MTSRRALSLLATLAALACGPNRSGDDGGGVTVETTPTPTCAQGQTSCDGACVDLSSSEAHCGACGVACPSGTVCSSGACQRSCAAPQQACGQSCVVTASDAANCGACGHACASGEACRDGRCEAADPCARIGQASCGTGCADT